jgi:hypothetical protein
VLLGARTHNGQLANFDRRLLTDAVIDGVQALHVIN